MLFCNSRLLCQPPGKSGRRQSAPYLERICEHQKKRLQVSGAWIDSGGYAR